MFKGSSDESAPPAAGLPSWSCRCPPRSRSRWSWVRPRRSRLRHHSAARVVSTSTLPDIPLAGFSNGLLPGSVDDDRDVDLGGIGSDLYPAERRGEYWTVTDRGPNGQIAVGKDKRRTFPVPGFDPAIVKVRAVGGRIEVLKSIPLTTASGAPVTGLPNQPGRDEAPYDHSATTPLAYNPNGLDTEGLVRDRDGSFWLVGMY